MRITLVCALSLVLILVGCALAVPNAGATAADAAHRASTPLNATVIAPMHLPAGAGRDVVLTMTGPEQGAVSDDWSALHRELPEPVVDHARAAGTASVFADAADLRVVGAGARTLFGAMMDDAFIDATLIFRAQRRDATFGERHDHTASTAWHGIFAKLTPQRVAAR